MSSTHVETVNRQFSLRHFRHENKLYNNFYSMLKDENLVDVIVSCDGTNIKAHRLVLSANSAYFKNLFDTITSSCQIPVVFLKDVDVSDMRAILEFMYKGEVSVDEKQLTSVLKCAELLKVYNLTEVCHALRTRLANEHDISNSNNGGNNSVAAVAVGGSSDDTNQNMSRSTPLKRPRINDGLHTQSVLLPQSTCNMRFDIRHGTANMTINQRSPIFAQNSPPISQSITSPTAKTISCLPQNQTHSSNTITSAQTQSNSMTTQVIITSHSSESNVQPKQTNSASTDRQTVIVPKTSTPNQINAINPKPPTTVWTPNQHMVTYSSRNTHLHSDKSKTAAVEVTIDDEPQDNIAGNSNTQEVSAGDIDVDIKPPIFEINGNESVSNKDIQELEIIQEKSGTSNITQNTSSGLKFVKTISTSTKSVNNESRASAIKYRSSSLSSSQSLPPPPSGRLVQRSTARLLRNIIKPPSSVASSSSVKSSKDSEEKTKQKKLVKKDKQQPFVGVVKYRNKNIVNITLDPSSSLVVDTPEIECPSCGIVFHDEKNWNDHIANVHLPFQT